MKVATAAYPLDPLRHWADYATKIEAWIADAAGQGAELLVFPEYGAMELSMLAGASAADELETSAVAVSERIGEADALHGDLAVKYKVHVLAASAPVFDPWIGERPVNRARLFTPTGGVGIQDKQIMTRFERDEWRIAPGGPLKLFDTALGRIGVLICYDGEFPLLGRALAEAELVLVPSATEARTGYSRVRIGAMARALEAQCVTVMSSTVGSCDWSEAVDENTGTGGFFGPPDTGFPPTGVMAEGVLNHSGWTYAEIDPHRISHVRADGVVLNRRHWNEQSGRDVIAETRRLG